MKITTLSGQAVAGLLVLCLLAGAHAAEVNTLEGVAIKGYDPVAYFTEHRAMRGNQAFATRWLGATWHFTSDDHRQAFEADPLAYAPQYGGFCSAGMARGGAFDVDPEAWRIVDGRLYLFSGDRAATDWESDGTAVERADEAWEERRAGASP